jgi:hypothetical protein
MSTSNLLRSGLLIVILLLTFVGQAQAQDSLPPQPPSSDDASHGPGPVQDENGLWYLPDGTHSRSIRGEVGPLATGGPDDFGYTWSDSVTLSWIDATSGTNTGLTGYADATGAIALPFPFKYYENTYSQVYIAASGYLSFSDWDYWVSQSEIPHSSEPNNVIAPYWTPTYIGTGSWVRYLSGGSAPNRYFVVEWHDVRGTDPGDFGNDDIYRFQVILHENGDIVFQYQNMIVTGTWFCGSAGIEDAQGLDGLALYGLCQYPVPPSNKAVRFYRPPAAPRVKFLPRQEGSFVTAGQTRTFPVSITNTGELGADTYDLTVSSAWPVSLYASNGTTLLTDTDSDGLPDTGAISQGASVGIVVSVTVPGVAGVENSDQIALTAASSLNPAKTKTFRLGLAIPSNFAGVFENDDDGAMQLLLARPSGQNTFKIAPDDSYGYSPAVAMTPNGNYLYAWNVYRWLGSYSVTEIEYAIVARNGSVIRPVSKLRDLSSATWYERDYGPSVSVAPNGTMGVAWYHYYWSYSANAYLYDVYFSALNSQGNLLYGPVNVTNNADPSTRFYDVSIAATDDNRFVIGWNNYNRNTYVNNIWYAVYNAASGAKIFGPQALTFDNQSWGPVLNPLPGGKAIITWLKNSGGPYFAVLNSNGSIAKIETNLNSGTIYYSPDAVALPNGKVAVAWGTTSGIGLSILDSAYTVESGPVTAFNPYSTTYNDGVSVTTDISNRVIVSWSQGDIYRNLFYALADSSGTFLTTPLPYQKSTWGIYGSDNGQGIAPLDAIPDPWVGGVAIASDQPVVTVGRPHVGAEVASYIGANSGDTIQFVPMLFKGAFGGGYNAALYVQNVSSESASLTMEFIDGSGAIVYTKNDILNANASKGYWLPSEAGLPTGFAGGVKVTSTQNILAVGRPHINGQVMTYNGAGAGSTTAWLPMFFKNGFGSYNTALYIQNVTANSADLTIQYLNLDGTVACEKADTLAANASKGYWSLTVACDSGALPVGFVGGVKVTSTQNILAVGRAHLGTQITTYNGFAGGATTAYVPMLFRNAFAGGSYKAALYLQNVSGDSADVTIEYVDNNGAVAASQNVNLAAGAISSIWLPSVAGLPDGFVGGARITATQDVVAVGRPHLGAEITAYNGTPGGSDSAYLSMLFRNAFGSYQSAFYVQNTTGNTANVNISFYDSAGALSCIKSISLAPNATTGFWMPTVSCMP